MTVYIALLRGININGKTVRMDALKSAFETMGLAGARTYIQTGNVLFRSDEGEESLKNRIEKSLEVEFGFPIPVVLRTGEELDRMIQALPFSSKEVEEAARSDEVETLYVALLPRIPLQENLKRLDVYQKESDQYRIIGRDIYLLFHNSIRDSKIAGNLHKLDVPSTVRNWNTIRKLAELANEMS